MKDDSLPILYVKTGCPWCDEVKSFMEGHGVDHREVNVSDNGEAFAEMRRKSKQDRAPTLDWHGAILADFGVDELKDFLHEHDVVLEDS